MHRHVGSQLTLRPERGDDLRRRERVGEQRARVGLVVEVALGAEHPDRQAGPVRRLQRQPHHLRPAPLRRRQREHLVVRLAQADEVVAAVGGRAERHVDPVGAGRRARPRRGAGAELRRVDADEHHRAAVPSASTARTRRAEPVAERRRRPARSASRPARAPRSRSRASSGVNDDVRVADRTPPTPRPARSSAACSRAQPSGAEQRLEPRLAQPRPRRLGDDDRSGGGRLSQSGSASRPARARRSPRPAPPPRASSRTSRVDAPMSRIELLDRRRLVLTPLA